MTTQFEYEKVFRAIAAAEDELEFKLESLESLRKAMTAIHSLHEETRDPKIKSILGVTIKYLVDYLDTFDQAQERCQLKQDVLPQKDSKLGKYGIHPSAKKIFRVLMSGTYNSLEAVLVEAYGEHWEDLSYYNPAGNTGSIPMADRGYVTKAFRLCLMDEFWKMEFAKEGTHPEGKIPSNYIKAFVDSINDFSGFKKKIIDLVAPYGTPIEWGR